MEEVKIKIQEINSTEEKLFADFGDLYNTSFSDYDKIDHKQQLLVVTD